MSGFALALGFVILANPELPKDIIQYPTREFQIPFVVDPFEAKENRDKIEKLRLFVSIDRGKTWKRVMDSKFFDERSGAFKFTADRDVSNGV
jgi:hypothetical protein